jgi:hypothetical protein
MARPRNVATLLRICSIFVGFLAVFSGMAARESSIALCICVYDASSMPRLLSNPAADALDLSAVFAPRIRPCFVNSLLTLC